MSRKILSPIDFSSIAPSNLPIGISAIEPSRSQRIFMPDVPFTGSGFLMVADTAYFVYVGRVVIDITPKFVECYMSTTGSGTMTAEIGLFSSPSPPNKSSQTLTKLVSTSAMTTLATTTGVKRNTSAFSQLVPASTHLWAGIRTNLGTTQPTLWGIGSDWGQGAILITSTAGVLTGSGPWTGALTSTTTTSAVGPALKVTMD